MLENKDNVLITHRRSTHVELQNMINVSLAKMFLDKIGLKLGWVIDGDTI